MSNRRDFFARAAAIGATLFGGRKASAQQTGSHDHSSHAHQHKSEQPATRGKTTAGSTQHHHHAGHAAADSAGNLPVHTPDLPKLPFKMVDGWKEFHLIAEPVRTELVPGRVMEAWGFNGSVPGPTIEVNQGDKVRVVFENRLPEMTAVHWHGFEVPMEMDGSVGLGQDPVPPGGKFVYEFELHQEGTYFYHSHFAMQEMMGMLGLFVMHPKEAYTPKCDRDFGLVLQEWALLPNNTVPNTLSMEFNWLTFNGKAGPDCTPMIVKQGERVRIRLINIGMDHHPIHLHGHQFFVTGTESGRIPEQNWFKQNTVIVGVAQARDIEFEAKYVGDWMVHCHLPHHMMNQMVSMVGPISHGAHGHGLGTGAGMEEGMGMLRQGNALAEEFGPSMGRGLGLAADADRSTSNVVRGGDTIIAQAQPQHGEHAGHASTNPAMDMYPKDDPEKKKVPGYPQDMWMVEDEKYAWKPENYGLRKGWTGGMMGMMTLVRVVTPEVYDKIMELKAKNPQRPGQPGGEHHHHQHGTEGGKN